MLVAPCDQLVTELLPCSSGCVPDLGSHPMSLWLNSGWMWPPLGMVPTVITTAQRLHSSAASGILQIEAIQVKTNSKGPVLFARKNSKRCKCEANMNSDFDFVQLKENNLFLLSNYSDKGNVFLGHTQCRISAN